MATDYSLPRISDSGDSISDDEASYILGLVAENLESAQYELGQILDGKLDENDFEHNRMRAATAQANTLQAFGLTAYLVLVSRLGDG